MLTTLIALFPIKQAFTIVGGGRVGLALADMAPGSVSAHGAAYERAPAWGYTVWHMQCGP